MRRHTIKSRAKRLCLRVVVDADEVGLFDDNGLTYIKARLRDY
jgi:hypothetical protein